MVKASQTTQKEKQKKTKKRLDRKTAPNYNGTRTTQGTPEPTGATKGAKMKTPTTQSTAQVDNVTVACPRCQMINPDKQEDTKWTK